MIAKESSCEETKPGMEDIYEEIVKIKARGEEAVLATVVATSGFTPRKEGAKMLVKADGKITGTVGGGALEGQVYEESLRLINSSEPRLLHFELTNEDASKEGMLCGGNMTVFIEPIKPLPSMIIFGGGHISFFLAKIGKMLDFRIVVVDDRPQFASHERFPEADVIIAEDFPSVMRRMEINKSSYIVIVTRGHLHDSKILEWAVTTDAAYVGMIGSTKKVRNVFSLLESKGTDPERLSRVHAPIGLPINAETPEEIAISILAEIIQVRRLSEAKAAKRRGNTHSGTK
jgi:xanthine dehydrogenase accessory factor